MKIEDMKKLINEKTRGCYASPDINNDELTYLAVAANMFPRLVALAECAKTIRHSDLIALDGTFPKGVEQVNAFLTAVDNLEAE